MKLFCPQDKKKLCSDCGRKSECKNHDLTDLIDMEKTSNERVRELKDHLSLTKEKKEQYEEVISQNRTIFEDMICDSFDKQIHELQKAKAKALMKVYSVLSHKQVEVNDAFGENSSLRAEVQKKIKNHMNFLKAENPLSVIEEDLSLLKKRAESLIGQDVADFEQQLSRIAPLIKERLDKAFSGRKQEDLPIILDQEIIGNSVMDNRSEDIEKLSLQVCGAPVDIYECEKKPTVFWRTPCGTSESVELDYQQVKKIDGIEIKLEAFEWDESKLKALELVLSAQAKTSRVNIYPEENEFKENLERYSHLFAILFKKPEEINELAIYFPSDPNLVMLMNAVLPQLSSLKRLNIISIDDPISLQNLNDLLENIALLAPHLEEF